MHSDPDIIEGLVSIILPVFNRPGFLREAIEQVLAQTYRPLELIIVDDGSTDETSTVCREAAERHPDMVRLLRQENAGPGVARERGRQVARGEFVQYLDSDDYIAPEKIRRQVEALHTHSDCGIAYCRTREYMIGDTGGAQCSCRTGERFAYLFPLILSGRCWQTVTPLFRRGVCDRIGPWASLRLEEDWEYDARAAALGVRLCYCENDLASHRHHHYERASGGWWTNPDKMRDRCQAHLLILQHARQAGVGLDDPNMRHFARELFLLTRQCGAVGLGLEARQLFQAAMEASGPDRAAGVDFRLYRLISRLVGWRMSGRVTCWLDRFRPYSEKVRRLENGMGGAAERLQVTP